PWGERGDDLFKTWIAAQRIPPRHQFQLTIAEGTIVTNGDGKLLAGQSVVANPGRDHRKMRDHDPSIDSIFFYWKKLDGSTAFSQRLFLPPKSGIDQAKHTQCRPVIWLTFNDFLLLHACISKRRPRFAIIFDHTSIKTFHECSAELDRAVTQGIFAEYC